MLLAAALATSQLKIGTCLKFVSTRRVAFSTDLCSNIIGSTDVQPFLQRGLDSMQYESSAIHLQARGSNPSSTLGGLGSLTTSSLHMQATQLPKMTMTIQ